MKRCNIFSIIKRRFQANAKRSELIIIVLLLVIHVSLIWLYRPYVYTNCDEKAGFAFAVVNNYPSFSAVLLEYLVFKIYYLSDSKVFKIFKARWKYVLLGAVVVGNYLYEGLDILIGQGDWYDMITITLGGIFILPFIYFKNKTE
ncbi:hypothetical protein [Bacteroides heparinolyticus]|uniref:hypothetical protein n=5 Tax=Prevotella heparinolytica TaxID=28113 RepID=UPI0023F08BD4|nr:hypothetical protein [Bacteroides heparinolyticus]